MPSALWPLHSSVGIARFFADEPFAGLDTTPLADRWIQNLGVPGKVDTVFGPAGGD